VVFFTYWQGVVIFLFSLGGAIKTPEEAADYQNVFICVEMLIAAFAHLYAFPYKEYAEVNVGRQTAPWNSLFHALNLTDVVHDTMHQFAPTYHDYVLYSDGGEGGEVAPKRYRARTFVPTSQQMSQEMESVPMPKSPAADARTNAPSNSGLVDLIGNPLINEGDFRQAYDMSPLEPAVIPHENIVDVELASGTVRPAQ
jgi:hypothetical protein